jgi:early secretory antigenic target protein ESAT-6
MTMLMPVRLLDYSRVRYDFIQLQQAADDIDEVVRAMQTTLDDLNRSLAGKLQYWDGGAYGSFSSTQTMWNTAAGEIATLLGYISKAVQDANQRMFETETLNKQMLSRGVAWG